MSTVAKIKICDVPELRKQLDDLYSDASQEEIAQWALLVSKHVLEQYAPSFVCCQAILDGYSVNESWQKGTARMHDVRQAGFVIHRLAKSQDDEVTCAALRVAGQAVSTGHMKEHGMVASDYAVKCCNLAYPNNESIVAQERTWQINELKNILNKN